MIQLPSDPRIMVLDPPTGIYYRDDRCQDRSGDIVTVAIRPPMNLVYIATILEKGGAVCFSEDYSLSGKFLDWKAFERDLAAFQPHAVLFNVTFPSLRYDLITPQVVKRFSKNILTVGRGIHFNLYDQKVLLENPDLDAVVRGEFEETLAEWVEKKSFGEVRGVSYRKDGKIVRNPDRPFIEEMDRIPRPNRKWIDNRKFLRADTGEPEANIRTSKGCPYNCIYCLASFVSGKKLRTRSVPSVIDEIEECIQNYGIRNFLFRSDLFTLDRSWLSYLCDEILARKLQVAWACNSRVDTLDQDKLVRMKKSGCWAIGMGVESGNEESLKKMKKGITLSQAEEAVTLCRKTGIKAFTYFLMGFPWETKKHLEDTIHFAIKLNADLAQFFSVYPFPGTELYQLGKEEKLFTDEDLHPYSTVKPVCGTCYLTQAEVEDYLSKAFKAFHLRPGYIARTLLKSGSPANALNYIKYGVGALRKLRKMSVTQP